MTESSHRRASQADTAGPLRRYFQRNGWRAAALPLLVVLTIVTAVRWIAMPLKEQVAAGLHHVAGAAAPPNAAGQQSLKVDDPGSAGSGIPAASDVLPPGGPYTTTGTGTFTVLPGTSAVLGTGGRLMTFSIDVENGVTGVDTTAFAAVAQSTLADPRSWIGANNIRLQRVDGATHADFRISLTSSMTVRKLCGYDLPVETSCFDSRSGRVVENVARWVRGDLAYVGDLATYHLYMFNHEVGHAIGHRHSHECLPGGIAPVMMQQTLGLKSITGEICQANPWPYPPGATGTPGVESADTPQNSPIQIPN